MTAPERLSQGWLLTNVSAFLAMSNDEALGRLTQRSSATGFASTSNLQIETWTSELEFLRRELGALLTIVPESGDWTLILEYEIPRRQKRIDAVLLAGSVIFSIELKLGASSFNRADLWQAEDYALDLRDFHLASRGYPIEPVLVCTGATTHHESVACANLKVHCVGQSGLAEKIAFLAKSSARASSPQIDPYGWDASAYSPTPSIIQATQQLFSTHTVENLSHAYADNLDATVAAIDQAVYQARSQHRHTICFVTGVPGAGKTLAGLAAVHAGTATANAEEVRGAYLSGNGPLVRILREAVARDAASRQGTLRQARRHATTLIQNVHEFLKDYGVDHRDAAPDEDIVVFDEAQRAWHAKKLAKRHKSIGMSEPELMLRIMSRKPGWAVIVALVGGGQEIHSGEAGLEEWGRALSRVGHAWRVFASPEVLSGGESVASHHLFSRDTPSQEVEAAPAMHLSVSVRSPRAKYLAEWVNAVLELRPEDAAKSLAKVRGFRIGLTRCLGAARAWLRDAARDEFRPGLLASSGNLRLRPYGLEVSPGFLDSYPLEHWFLGPRGDVRSSGALEVAMSEFKVQGLELDLVALCWGDDLTIGESGQWEMRAFRGDRWQKVRDATRQNYLLNKYRVLMTRAREGLVIWVPPGDSLDATRDPARLERTARYLRAAGLPVIDSTH